MCGVLNLRLSIIDAQATRWPVPCLYVQLDQKAYNGLDGVAHTFTLMGSAWRTYELLAARLDCAVIYDNDPHQIEIRTYELCAG